jgi:hypothetical protein
MWTAGDVPASEGLMPSDHLYAAHVNELRRAIDARVALTVGSASGNTYVTDGVADNVQINAAILAVGNAGGGLVLLGDETYAIARRITNRSNVRVIGRGKGVTTLQGAVASDYTFYNSSSISNFGLEHLTIDVERH